MGASVEVPLSMMQGDSALSSQLTPDIRIVPEQQSVAPSVPSIEPQPTPPHWPLHASAQQTVPSELSTPARPLEQLEETTSDEQQSGENEIDRTAKKRKRDRWNETGRR